MKKLLLILISLPLFAISQNKDDVYGSDYYSAVSKKIATSAGVQDSMLGTSIILKDNAIIFQKVYTTEYSQADLANKLTSFLPSVKNFQLTSSPNQKETQFSGRLKEFIVNYRKYGGTLMGTSMALNYPMDANVIVQIKDQKYRVTISEVSFKYSSELTSGATQTILLDDVISKSKRRLMKTTSTAISIAKYIDQDFSDSFDLKKELKLKNDF